MASLLQRLSLQTPATLKPATVVQACRKGADVLIAITTPPAPAKAVEQLEKSLDNLHLLLFETPYTPTGGGGEMVVPRAATKTDSAGGTSSTTTSSVSSSISSSVSSSSSSSSSSITSILASLVIQEDVDLFLSLVHVIRHLNFEHRKLVAILFNHLYRHEECFRDYVISKVILLDYLVSAYAVEQHDICINLHNILYSCVKKGKKNFKPDYSRYYNLLLTDF